MRRPSALLVRTFRVANVRVFGVGIRLALSLAGIAPSLCTHLGQVILNASQKTTACRSGGIFATRSRNCLSISEPKSRTYCLRYRERSLGWEGTSPTPSRSLLSMPTVMSRYRARSVRGAFPLPARRHPCPAVRSAPLVRARAPVCAANVLHLAD